MPLVKAIDRRKAHRYKFSAVIEVADTSSGRRVRASLADLSLQGCRIATSEPFPLGVTVNVLISKSEASVAAEARVVFALDKFGMGLLFTSMEPEPLQVLSAWVAEARESAWLSLSLRRSQRVVLSVPLRVVGKNARDTVFEEFTETVAVSAHGAQILTSRLLSKGQLLTLFNIRTGAATECTVVHIGKSQGQRTLVGLEFLLPSPGFWHVAFPPKGWSARHADAKKPVPDRSEELVPRE